ncbi:MAG TPA: SGNH/GDSL hydrolase family protein, partial [Verrucomicrobiaceae bacterium]
MMNIRLALLLLAFGGMAFTALPAADAKAPAKTAAKPSPSTAPIQDVPGLPRVLLIGDSISMGYTLPVRKLLEGKANVHRIPTNGGPSKKGMTDIDKWLGDGKWDVIHFNFGIHDLKFMPDGKRQVESADYEKNLRSLVAKMKATGAKVIFATTTPIPSDSKPNKFGSVKEYNDIARQVMEENGVKIDDLNALITPELAKYQLPENVHYHGEGYEFMAKQVAAEIEAVLP